MTKLHTFKLFFCIDHNLSSIPNLCFLKNLHPPIAVLQSCELSHHASVTLQLLTTSNSSIFSSHAGGVHVQALEIGPQLCCFLRECVRTFFIVLSPRLLAPYCSTSVRLWSSSLEKSCLKALSWSWQACLQKCFCPTLSDGDNHSLFLRDGPVVIDAKTLHGIQATQAGIDTQNSFAFPFHWKDWGDTT